ncbi:hypothetical protein [Okeania sp. SIO2B9]|uniref:hypothetical protein n=1 Tax=Okeania sp. SIO2B9 TaxID=2607782 RepID=UPI00257E461C|nr:hypothetical protein [Okeania sp. SIO2B9]
MANQGLVDMVMEKIQWNETRQFKKKFQLAGLLAWGLLSGNKWSRAVARDGNGLFTYALHKQ